MYTEHTGVTVWYTFMVHIQTDALYLYASGHSNRLTFSIKKYEVINATPVYIKKGTNPFDDKVFKTCERTDLTYL